MNSKCYINRLVWKEGKKAQISSYGLPDLEVATPPEFDGPLGYWSPEQLFVAAANACLMTTFLAIAENSRLSFESYSSCATGKLEKMEEGGFQITRIVVKPRLTLAPGEDMRKASRVIAKSEEHCLIARSIKAQVVMEPEIILAPETVSAVGI